MRLREASTRLTAIAAEIDRVVGGLVSAGGEETWLGPAADDYRSAVRIRRRSASEIETSPGASQRARTAPVCR